MVEPGEQKKAPEAPFNRVLIQTLKTLDASLRKKGTSPLHITKNGISLVTEGITLVQVTASDVSVAAQSFQDKLKGFSASPEDHLIDIRFGRFLNDISHGTPTLNHLGISYFCGSITRETQKIKKLAEINSIPLQEEPTSEIGQRWLFLGNSANWENPLFELVLNEGKQNGWDFWRPHFQIDINTSLSMQEIRNAAERSLGNNFIKWQLGIPEVGVVLGMGVLGEVGGIKIALGIGTDKRGTEEHRKNELKPLK